MKTTALAVGLFAALTLNLGAQETKQEKKAKPQTQTVWTMKISGIGG